MFGIKYSKLKSGRFGDVSITKARLTIPPVPEPEPIARYDFNNYTEGSPTITNSVVGQPDANISMYFANSFSQSSNSYLQLYYEFFPGQCGNITAPIYTFRTIEIWFQYPAFGLVGAGQYILDARTGAESGFWIASNSPGTGTMAIGSDIENSKLYLNVTNSSVLTSSSPDTLNQIYGTGWTQLVLVLPADTTDDITFFSRFTGEQATYYAQVADIALYSTALTDNNIKTLFNAKCGRYGLSPIP